MDTGTGFTFYDKQEKTRYFLVMEQIIDFTILVSVLTLYFIVFAKLIMLRRSGSANIASSIVELRILIIAVVSFFYESTYLLLWIFDCGFFSVATILINSSLRRKIFQFLKISNKSSTSIFVTRAQASVYPSRTAVNQRSQTMIRTPSIRKTTSTVPPLSTVSKIIVTVL
ncbi:hypothetical protein L596_030530 [Steinernema carpocapsae]|uniref:Uncharacterized protein n=1 Tax=Steinernema carpocapsae TaxID=34508 RepID=A0A4U5LPN2_STECR|nr:hypothetical protein L596_030530 [Steinernema carpocapsae]